MIARITPLHALEMTMKQKSNILIQTIEGEPKPKISEKIRDRLLGVISTIDAYLIRLSTESNSIDLLSMINLNTQDIFVPVNPMQVWTDRQFGNKESDYQSARGKKDQMVPVRELFKKVTAVQLQQIDILRFLRRIKDIIQNFESFLNNLGSYARQNTNMTTKGIEDVIIRLATQNKLISVYNNFRSKETKKKGDKISLSSTIKNIVETQKCMVLLEITEGKRKLIEERTQSNDLVMNKKELYLELASKSDYLNLFNEFDEITPYTQISMMISRLEDSTNEDDPPLRIYAEETGAIQIELINYDDLTNFTKIELKKEEEGNFYNKKIFDWQKYMSQTIYKRNTKNTDPGQIKINAKFVNQECVALIGHNTIELQSGNLKDCQQADQLDQKSKEDLDKKTLRDILNNKEKREDLLQDKFDQGKRNQFNIQDFQYSNEEEIYNKATIIVRKEAPQNMHAEGYAYLSRKKKILQILHGLSQDIIFQEIYKVKIKKGEEIIPRQEQTMMDLVSIMNKRQDIQNIDDNSIMNNITQDQTGMNLEEMEVTQKKDIAKPRNSGEESKEEYQLIFSDEDS